MPEKNPFDELTDAELLTLCIYGEARGEPPIGKLAVAHIVLNRAKKPCWWGRGVRECILKPKQFSCFNADDKNRPLLLRQINTGVYDPTCLAVALLALQGHTVDPTGGATHYHAVGCNPAWNDGMTFLRRINRHLFYREGE